jgi:hypothetical protein
MDDSEKEYLLNICQALGGYEQRTGDTQYGSLEQDGVELVEPSVVYVPGDEVMGMTYRLLELVGILKLNVFFISDGICISLSLSLSEYVIQDACLI